LAASFTREVLQWCAQLPDLQAQVLVPSERRGREAVDAGAQRLVFVVSVSEAHNRNNVRRHPLESVDDYERLVRGIPAEIGMRLDIATAFDCPFAGRVPEGETLALLDRLIPIRPNAEICLCDTTGRADPDHVSCLLAQAMQRFPKVASWALHAHDTYGLGLANVYAAFRQGVRVFDASFGGLGGCPFAPGATGNVATEDLAWMFERMGIATGINIASLVPVAREAASLPGALPGGRVREAILQAPRHVAHKQQNDKSEREAGGNSGNRQLSGDEPKTDCALVCRPDSATLAHPLGQLSGLDFRWL
jgi:hydroxymethylglutaryl-CoA lyase